MPQLMPLSWMFSSMMVLLIIMSAGMVYSEKIIESEVNMSMKGVKSSMSYWCW